MASRRRRKLNSGDTVSLSGSSLLMYGTVVELLDHGYVRVRWTGSLACTTHSQHALELMEPLEA